jgi:hypothetical protein
MAFWRIAPGVRFINFAILTTAVFLRECDLRSLTCRFVQATRLVRPLVFFRVVAIDFVPVWKVVYKHMASTKQAFRVPAMVARGVDAGDRSLTVEVPTSTQFEHAPKRSRRPAHTGLF